MIFVASTRDGGVGAHDRNWGCPPGDEDIFTSEKGLMQPQRGAQF
jgi:hypothetical protein